MSPILPKSSSTDMTESMHDRYSAIQRIQDSMDDGDDDDDDETNNYSLSLQSSRNSSIHHGTTASESSYSGRYSGTYATSFVTDGTETLGYIDEYEDLETLSLYSQPMVGDGFVDSACACLDYPTAMYQRMCSGRENSLLRQSKGRSRPTITHRGTAPSNNLSVSVAKRRSLRLQSKGITEATLEESQKNEIQIMRIQPKEDFEVKEFESYAKKKKSHPATTKKADKELRAVDSKKEDEVLSNGKISDDKKLPEQAQEKEKKAKKKTNREPEAVRRRVMESPPEDSEERKVDAPLSTNLSKDMKIDPPMEPKVVASRVGQNSDSYPENYCDDNSSSEENDPIVISRKDSASEGGNHGTSSPKTQNISEAVTHLDGNEVPRPDPDEELPEPFSKDDEHGDDGNKTQSNDIEIIKVLSMDDQDSWTPGSRDIIEQITKDGSRSRESNGAPSQGHSQSQSTDELWIHEGENEEAASPKHVIAHELTEDLLNGNSTNVHKSSSNDVFDDVKAREMFLDRRQGRLRDAALGNRNALQSQLRRANRGEEVKGLVGRNPPAPEFRTMVKQSESMSRERNLAIRSASIQHTGKAVSSHSRLPSRKNDLVAVRSIEEAQRMRSFRAPNKQEAGLHQHSNAHAPIDVHNYVGESPYDEMPSRTRHGRKLDPQARPSPLPISRGYDLTHIVDTEGKHRLNDERDDQESLPSFRPIESRPEKNRSITTSDELRKLEKKIERHLRQVKREQNSHDQLQSEEIRRMEKKLSKQFYGVSSDDPEATVVSSREVRRYEKQLAQQLSMESENRASRLQRIKRKGLVSSSRKIENGRSPLLHASSTPSSPELVTTPSPSGKLLSETSEEEPSKFEFSRGLRSRYVRRSARNLRKGYSRVPETD